MSFLADIGSGAISGVFSGIGSLAKDIRTAITGVDPAQAALIEQKLMEIEAAAQQGQMQINLEEAKSEHLFVSGWRPACGWCGAFALAYASIIEPFISWIARVYGYTGVFPVLNTEITMQILFGILGLGVMRTVDKRTAPAPLGKE